MKLRRLFVLVLLLRLQDLCIAQTGFTYQGRLFDGGLGGANGSYDFQFQVAADPTNDVFLGAQVTQTAVPVVNGLFIVALDFGASVFNGSPRWLDISVRTNTATVYTRLQPRQVITSTPYAIFANSASNLAPGVAISANGWGLTNLNGANVASGTISSNQLNPVTWEAATATATNIVQAIGDRRYANVNLGRGWLTPYDCGAVGDGVADDTVALQSWLNNATRSNFIAFLPAATGPYYRITDTLWVTNLNGLRLQGAGGQFHSTPSQGHLSQAQIRQFTPGKHGIVIAAPYGGGALTDSVHIDGICVTAQYYSPGSWGIAFNGNGSDTDCDVIEECGIEGFGIGLYIAAAADLSVRSCSFGLNGDGVLLPATNVLGSPSILNSIRIETSQLSYNYSNQVHMLGGSLVLDTCDIASVAWPDINGAIGLRIEDKGYADVRWCNFEAYSTNPAVLVTSSIGMGPYVRFTRGGIGRACSACPGPNTYSVVLTNAYSYFDGLALNSLASDGFSILEANSSSGTPSSIAGSGAIREKFIRFNTVYTNYITPYRTEFTPGWPVTTPVFPGEFYLVKHDNLDTELRFGATLASYGPGITWFDLLQYHHDRAASASFNQLSATSFSGDGSQLTNIKDATASGLSMPTNSPPANTTTVRAWINVTNNGAVYRIPLYQ